MQTFASKQNQNGKYERRHRFSFERNIGRFFLVVAYWGTEASIERGRSTEACLLWPLAPSPTPVAVGETNFLSELYRQTPMRFSRCPPPPLLLPSTHSFHFTTVRRPRRSHRRRNGLFYCTLSDHPQGKEEVPSFLSLHNFPFPGKKARERRLRTMWEREARRSYISTAPFLIESSELGKEWEKGGGRKALSGSGCALLSSFTSTSPVLLASPLFQTFP